MRVSRQFARILVVALGASAVSGCGSSGSSFSCSLKNPTEIDEGVGQWPKFRRDRQNTGTISLTSDGFAALNQFDDESGWRFPDADEGLGSFVASPIINSTQSVIYIGSTNSRFYALNFEGERFFATPTPVDTPKPQKTPTPGGSPTETATPSPTPAFFEINSEPSPFTAAGVVGIRDDRDAVYVGNGNAFVFGVDINAGPLKQRWPSPFDSYVAGSLAIGHDGTVFGTTLGRGLSAVCPNGATRFAGLAVSSESSPAIGRNPDKKLDSTVYYGSDDRQIRAVSKEGIVRWAANLPAPILNAPIVQLNADGTDVVAVYVIDANGTFLKFNDRGQRDSAFRFFGPVPLNPVVSSPALAVGHLGSGPQGTLYVAIDDTMLAVDASTGAIRWTYSLASGARIQSSPAVAVLSDAAGTVDPTSPATIVVGADDGVVYFLRDDGAGASLINSHDTGGSVVSSPAIAADGTVVVGSTTGHVHAIR